MTSQEHRAVDNAIVAYLSEHGPKHFRHVRDHLGTTDYRTVDRRLQSLRKRGILAFDTKLGWSVVLTEAKS